MADERKIYIKSGGYKEIHNTGLYVEGNYYKGTLNPQVIDSVTKEIENLLIYFQENEDPSMREALAVVEESKSRQPELNNSDTIRAVIDNSPTLKRRLLSASKTLVWESVKCFFPVLDVATETIESFRNPDN